MVRIIPSTSITSLNVTATTLVRRYSDTGNVESYEDKNGNKVDWSEWHGTTTKEPPYDQLEPRFAATIIYRGSTWKGRVMDCSVGRNKRCFHGLS